MQLVDLWSRFYLGEIKGLTRRALALAREADERGDLYAATSLRIGTPAFHWLVEDDTQGAEEARRVAMSRWPSGYGYHTQHWWDLVSRTRTALYAQDGERACRMLDEEWHLLKRSQLLRVELVRVEALHLRAASQLVASRSAPVPARLLAKAEKNTRRIERLNLAWGAALAILLRAGLASARSNDSEAAHLFDSAVRALEDADMGLCAAAARRRRGVLLGGDEGQSLIEEADQFMKSQGIVSPQRMTALLAPG